MAVYVNNITINTGAYFSKDFYLDNIDGSSLNLAGYGASSYVRKHPSSLNTAAEFTVGFVDRDNGRIRLSLSSNEPYTSSVDTYKNFKFLFLVLKYFSEICNKL